MRRRPRGTDRARACTSSTPSAKSPHCSGRRATTSAMNDSTTTSAASKPSTSKRIARAIAVEPCPGITPAERLTGGGSAPRRERQERFGAASHKQGVRRASSVGMPQRRRRAERDPEQRRFDRSARRRRDHTRQEPSEHKVVWPRCRDPGPPTQRDRNDAQPMLVAREAAPAETVLILTYTACLEFSRAVRARRARGLQAAKTTTAPMVTRRPCQRPRCGRASRVCDGSRRRAARLSHQPQPVRFRLCHR